MASKKQAYLIGEHLSHSFSPAIHKELGDYSYKLKELPPTALADFLKDRQFDALYVTIPYKQAVIPHLDALDAVAARIGAVNTVICRDGKLFGYNTDYDGLAAMIDSLGVSLAGKKVLVLGSGGASHTATALAADRGAADVVVISRNGENNYQNLEKHRDAKILINATPVGMYPQNGKAPLALSKLPQLEAVFDLIYNPARTALLLEAEALGIPHRNGLLMLVAQAHRAAELFLGKALPKDIIPKITNALAAQTENIILIGMPGCGKTTLGKALAALLGRPFFDADAEIEKQAGRSIPDIFKNEGEAAFRRLETEALRTLCRESGSVIATGGGTVTVAENYPLLHQNGKIIFLDTPPAGLSVAGRPLSATRSPETLYRERLPLYRRFADVTLPITRNIEDNLNRLKEILLQ